MVYPVLCFSEDEGQRYLEMQQEEQGIPASSQQAEPAGFTQETYYPLPNETDHSRYVKHTRTENGCL